jgi:hypothetical protein
MWRGRPESIQFAAHIPEHHPPKNVIGTVTVSQNSIPLGHVKFKLTIANTKSDAPAISDCWVRYKKAFISYASQDRAEVLKRVQMLSVLNLKFFQDVLDLSPGDRWRKELYRHIDESDLFLLFWSSHAKRSEEVMKEVRYAKARKRGDEYAPPEIIPVIIEGPPPVEPPPELSHIHFNDYLVYFIR